MTNMTEPCEHCHFHEADDHPVWRLLMLVVVAAILYQIVTQLDQLEARVKKLENPPLPPRARAKLDKIEESE